MIAFLQNDLPKLESLKCDDALDFEHRLSALEEFVSGFSCRLENEVFTTIRRLEEALCTQMVTTKKDLDREISDRQHQFAALATKVSKKIDGLQRTAISIEEKHRMTGKQIQTKFEDQINEAREQISTEASELRSILRAKLEELTNGRSG